MRKSLKIILMVFLLVFALAMPGSVEAKSSKTKSTRTTQTSQKTRKRKKAKKSKKTKINKKTKSRKKAKSSKTAKANKKAKLNKKTKTTKILFIGNSLTKRGEFTSQFAQMCRSNNKKVSVTMVAKNGTMFTDITNTKTNIGMRAHTVINSQKWDYVVLQENTDLATAKPEESLKNAGTLIKWIRKSSPKAKIIWNATWAYKNGRIILDKNYTFPDNQNAINQTYRKLQNHYGGTIAYTGDAFREFRQKYNYPELYVSDNNHQTNEGGYLEALTVYKAIYGTADVSTNGKISAKSAEKIRKFLKKG